MKYQILGVSLVIGLAIPLQSGAQESDSTPLPAGPLLKRTPDASSWTVESHKKTTSPDDTEASADSGSRSDNKGSPKAAICKVTKSGKVILEEINDSSGRKKDIWHTNGWRVIKSAESTQLSAIPDHGSADIYSIDFNTSDFSGLDWISPNSFSGMSRYHGRDCMVFKGSVSPLAADSRRERDIAISTAEQASAAENKTAPNTSTTSTNIHSEDSIPAIAYIDLDTRLPLYAEFGSEVRNYYYAQAPNPITIPADVSKALQVALLRAKLLSH